MAAATWMVEARQKVYPRSVQGPLTRWRWLTVWLTQLVFYGLPWLPWGNRQSVLFDLEARRFYVFDLVLYPQDFVYLTGLLIISALSLFLFTAVAGRLWCGFACPQTVYTEIFLWIERRFEGDRSARMRRDASGNMSDRFMRKAGKHLAWMVTAMWTGLTFVGYFTPIRDLLPQLVQLNLGSWEIFWVLFYGLATYGNAGFMREMVCKHMCPYARFQSAMFDKDTLIVTYDRERGEPRGARSRKADSDALHLGSCIDCHLCVQVCPTGIDIRKGLQYECISCGACADVCDSVMDKMQYPRGLVRYSTQNALTHRWTNSKALRQIFRPRVLAYAAMLLGLIAAMVISLAMRHPFKVDIERDRGVVARIVQAGYIENVYRLQIMNATERSQQYRLSVTGLPGLKLIPVDPVVVDATQATTIPVRLQLAPDVVSRGAHEVFFEVEAIEGGSRLREKTTFVVPN